MGFGVHIGRALADLPAEILIPIMIVLIIWVGLFYAKGKIPRTLTFHSMIAFALFTFAGYIVYILGLPEIISTIFIILGVVSIFISLISGAYSIYHNKSIENRKAKAYFLIFVVVYLIFMMIFICFIS